MVETTYCYAMELQKNRISHCVHAVNVSLFTSMIENRSVALDSIIYGSLEKLLGCPKIQKITDMSVILLLLWVSWLLKYLLLNELDMCISIFLSFPTKITEQTRKQKYLRISQGETHFIIHMSL